jgi:hypothetical protein
MTEPIAYAPMWCVAGYRSAAAPVEMTEPIAYAPILCCEELLEAEQCVSNARIHASFGVDISLLCPCLGKEFKLGFIDLFLSLFRLHIYHKKINMSIL